MTPSPPPACQTIQEVLVDGRSELAQMDVGKRFALVAGFSGLYPGRRDSHRRGRYLSLVVHGIYRRTMLLCPTFEAMRTIL